MFYILLMKYCQWDCRHSITLPTHIEVFKTMLNSGLKIAVINMEYAAANAVLCSTISTSHLNCILCLTFMLKLVIFNFCSRNKRTFHVCGTPFLYRIFVFDIWFTFTQTV